MGQGPVGPRLRDWRCWWRGFEARRRPPLPGGRVLGRGSRGLCSSRLLVDISALGAEVIGDNSYYLGFLFTLTSLAVTLYFVVDVAAEDRAFAHPEVISGFGVALVSTLVGVFIRVLMMQFRLDLVAREREQGSSLIRPLGTCVSSRPKPSTDQAVYG